jgi:succinate dehydrogenase / fumarate reductase cytochrome b subunit
MTTVSSVAWSSVGKKFLSGLTGLALVLFVIVHLVGNLTLFIGPGAFNGYARFLEHLVHGWFIIAFEIGLITLLLIHIITGIYVAWVDKERARPVKYQMKRNAGGGSKKTISSRSMIITGIVLGFFVVLHVNMFKFGAAGVYTSAGGTEMKDLYTLVATSFKDIWITGAYLAVMILLGFHLRHGAWSAFQSLGWNNDKYMDGLNRIALVFAFLLAVGFLILPLYFFFFVDPSAVQAAGPGGH